MKLIYSLQARRFIKMYEPFVYSVCSLITALVYIVCCRNEWSDEDIMMFDRLVFVLSATGGFSVTTVVRMLCFSGDMCKWYKSCLLFNFLVLADSILYYCRIFDINIYAYSAATFSALALLCFFIFLVGRKINAGLKRLKDRY